MNRNIKNILLGITLVLVSSSCEKEWLDVTANTQIRAAEQFESEDGFKDALIGVYIGMTDPAMYAKDMTWNAVDLLSQQYATLPDLALYGDVQQFEYRTTRSTDQLDALWRKSYNLIANINLALEYIDKNDAVLGDIDYAIIKGELLGLRAMLHFDLMRLYGWGDLENRNSGSAYAIPYVTEYGKEVTPQMSYVETFALLEDDIQQALELLKQDPVYPGERPADYYTEVNRNGFYSDRELRMNYFAVKALQARLLLWQGGSEKLEKAAQAAEEVISQSTSSLISSENYPVSSDPIFYPEILFGLNVEAFADIVNPYLDADSDTNYDALYYTQAMADDIFETDNINVGLADVRYNTLLQSKTSGLISIKLLQKDNLNRNTMPLIKLPEMFYIAAEHYLESGNLEKAIEYLNTVRRSRGIIEDIPSDADPARVRAELTQEYRKEFLMEGQLFFYYKRNGMTSIPGLSENITVDDAIYVLPYPDNEVEFGNR